MPESMDIFVESLLSLSERAATIARRCREEEELFSIASGGEERRGKHKAGRTRLQDASRRTCTGNN